MRVAIYLMALTMATLLAGAIVVAAEEDAPDAPAGMTAEDQGDLDQVIEKVNAIEAVEEPGNEAELAEESELEGLAPVVVPEIVGLDPQDVWQKSPDDMPLLTRLVKGVLRSRGVKVAKGERHQFYWERGGVAVPEDQMVPLAAEWAAAFLAALDAVEQRTGVQLPVWGAFATMANEGGFWECSLNYEARKWAAGHSCKRLTTETWHGRTVTRKIERKLVDKFRQTYTCDEVWDIIHDPHYKDAKIEVKGRDGQMKWVGLNNKADGGPWQRRFSVKSMNRVQFDRLMSRQPGVYLGAREMARRALAYSYRFRVEAPHPRPWMLWPGWNPNADRALKYDDKITMVARFLGARKDEIERGYVVVDTARKKPRYRTVQR